MANLVGKQVCVVVCDSCVYRVIRVSVEIAVGPMCQQIEWRLVWCILILLFVLIVKVEGVGGDGRLFMLSRPSDAEQISTLWGLYHQTLKDNAELKSQLDFQVSVIV